MGLRKWIVFATGLAILGLIGSVVVLPDRAESAASAGYLVLYEDGTVGGTGSAVPAGGIDLADGGVPVALAAFGENDGYYLVNDLGRVVARGDAPHLGDLTGIDLDQPIVDMVPIVDGSGYYLLAADGGVFVFGADARFHGSLPAIVPFSMLVEPIVAMVVQPDASGYWLFAADGGVFAFGSAPFHGSVPGVVSGRLNGPIVAAAASSGSGGYGLVGSDGGIFAFGSFEFLFSFAASGSSYLDLAESADGYALLAESGAIVGSDEIAGQLGQRAVSFDTIGDADGTLLPTPAPAPTPTPTPGPIDPVIGSFGLVELAPDFDLDGVGADVDSIAFWEAPDPLDTLMFVTSKKTEEVEVWKFPFVGNEQTTLKHSSFVDGEVNGVAMDQDAGLLYVSTSSPTSTLSVFSYPGGKFVKELVRGRLDLAEEPNLALLSTGPGPSTIYLTADNIIHILNVDTGEVLGSFATGDDVETVMADAFWKRVWVPDEQRHRGVFLFNPDGSLLAAPPAQPVGAGVFEKDAEGILLYRSTIAGLDTGAGFVVVSDQRPGATDFEFFDRETALHLGTVRLTGVSNTDGVGSTQVALPGYRLGIFAAINNDGSVAGIGWDKVLAAIGAVAP